MSFHALCCVVAIQHPCMESVVVAKFVEGSVVVVVVVGDMVVVVEMVAAAEKTT